MRIRVRQQRQEACTLDSSCELTLIPSLGASDTAWHYLARFGHVGLECFQILVIDFLGAFSGKATKTYGDGKNVPW